MFVYQCYLTLLENTFFASREINDLYLTEPLVGNYALAYALGFVKSPYYNRGEIYYYDHLTHLNQQGIYITPATIPQGQEPKFSFSQFNSVPDTYWFAMGSNCLVQRPEGYRMEHKGDKGKKVWNRVNKKTGESKKHERAVNYPQIGFIKLMGIGTNLQFFVISTHKLTIPRYIRLGKFMSKAKIEVISYEDPEMINCKSQIIDFLLNPLDLSEEMQMTAFDTYNIHPVPLIRNARLTGEFLQLKQNLYLPAGMQFGVDCLKPLVAN
jgi:CRISPR-associated protein Csc1